MDRNKIRKEILELVDSNPCNEVDLKEIIEKYTAGLDIEAQGVARCTIENIVTELKESEDIKPIHASHITTRLAGQYPANSWKIRSTHKREEKLESSKKQKESSVHIEGDVIGSMVGSQSLDNALISPATQIQNNISDINPKKRSWLEIASWVAAILATIIALWEFLIKRFI